MKKAFYNRREKERIIEFSFLFALFLEKKCIVNIECAHARAHTNGYRSDLSLMRSKFNISEVLTSKKQRY